MWRGVEMRRQRIIRVSPRRDSMRRQAHIWAVSMSDHRITRGEVHVWRLNIEDPPRKICDPVALLSSDEVERAYRFRSLDDRMRYSIVRAGLRVILAMYLDTEPRSVRISYTQHGKPILFPLQGSPNVTFNLTHSDRMALYAVSYARDVGIDVERIREIKEMDRLAERFFSSEEASLFLSLPLVVKREAFFTCWTLKEAYVKARGEGLSLPLDQFDVSFVPGQPAALLRVHGQPEEASRWSVRLLRPEMGHIGALAVKGTDWKLSDMDCDLFLDAQIR